MLFDLLLLSITLILSCVIFYTWNYDYWKKRHIPYEKPMFPFGSIKDGLLLKKPLGTLLNDLYYKYKDYKYFGVYFGRHPVLFIRDPELFKIITVKKFNDFQDNTATMSEKSDLLAAINPFILKGDRWKISRTHLSPAFTSLKLKQMYPSMAVVSERLVTYLTKNFDNLRNGFKIKEVARDFASEVFTLCGLNITSDSFENPKSSFKVIAQQMFETESFIGIVTWILMIVDPALSLLLRTKLMTTEASEYFRNVVKDVYNHRKENRTSTNDYFSYLDKLQSENSDFTEDDLVSNVVTLFIDGVETTASNIRNAIYEIAANPRVFRKLRDEIDSVMSKYNNELTYDALQEMTYLDCCVSETLRMQPLFIWYMRKCTAAAFDFPPAKEGIPGMKIDKGISVLLPVYSLQHDSNLHPNPDIFYPERFSDEETKAQAKAHYYGFGDGPRLCLAMRYGQIVTKLSIWAIVSNFDLVVSEKTKNRPKNIGPSFLYVPEEEPIVNIYKRGEIYKSS